MNTQQIYIFIIDAMSLNDIKIIEKNKEKLPFLNFLIENGHNFENCYSNSAPTEFVMPSFFSSSLPIDFNTYQNGINNRKIDVINKFRNKGYKVNIFTNTAMLTKLYGYKKFKYKKLF